MKTAKQTVKAPKMTQEECRAALDAARKTVKTCEAVALLVSDWDTLKALKAARATVADLQHQWDKMQPAPAVVSSKRQPAPQSEQSTRAITEFQTLQVVQLMERAAYGFILEEETIQGQNVQKAARECVDLSVAFSPVIVAPGCTPTNVESTNGGTKYRVMFDGDTFQNVTPDELKVMRARYLLKRGEKYQELQQGKPFDHEAQVLFPDGVAVYRPPIPHDANLHPLPEPSPELPRAAFAPADATSTPTDETMARLKFGWLLRAMGQDEAVKTDGKLDEVKLKRACNEIVRDVASDRPTPTTDTWIKAASLHSERNGYAWHEATKKWERSAT